MRKNHERRPESVALVEPNNRDTDSPTQLGEQPLLIRDLGWSDEEAAETYYRFRSFSEDWNAPEMDAYDDL